MLALGLVLNTVCLGVFCWLIFALAVYAVPFFVAVGIGISALNSGASVIGALFVGIVAGGSTLVMSQIAFAMTRSTILRAGIGAIFSVPAAIAGYHVVLAMSQLGAPSLAWREIFACLGAVSVGATAWMRLTLFAESRPLVPSGAVGSGPQATFTGATRGG
ncbi:hypothetical protein [Bradyrhizobium algeriense]|uniref:hypothetical protein n=1 Tax=Bradyrhizobium algeriense TaxID=634784 RepID=UPI000D34B437|nr:hypothetical protein [Bradyrhizobium algeriense]